MKQYKIVALKTVRLIDEKSIIDIPFNSPNADYIRFKKEIQGIGEFGESITPAELQDAEGNTMTTEEVEEFVATLP